MLHFIFHIREHDGERFQNNFEIIILFVGSHNDRKIRIKSIKFYARQTNFFCFICWQPLRCYKHASVKSILFTFENDSTFTFLKNSTLQKIVNDSDTILRNLAFKKIMIKFRSQLFVNSVELEKTDFFTPIINAHQFWV